MMNNINNAMINLYILFALLAIGGALIVIAFFLSEKNKKK